MKRRVIVMPFFRLGMFDVFSGGEALQRPRQIFIASVHHRYAPDDRIILCRLSPLVR